LQLPLPEVSLQHRPRRLGSLAILPGVTHYNIFASPALVPTVMPSLDAPMLEQSEFAKNRMSIFRRVVRRLSRAACTAALKNRKVCTKFENTRRERDAIPEHL